MTRDIYERCPASSHERRMGDSNPRGLSPNTLSKCLNGGGKCSLACVAAGQRGARMVRTTPGWGWIGKNCYQSCYRCADHGNGVSAPRDLVMRRVSRAADAAHRKSPGVLIELPHLVRVSG